MKISELRERIKELPPERRTIVLLQIRRRAREKLKALKEAQAKNEL